MTANKAREFSRVGEREGRVSARERETYMTEITRPIRRFLSALFHTQINHNLQILLFQQFARPRLINRVLGLSVCEQAERGGVC